MRAAVSASLASALLLGLSCSARAAPQQVLNKTITASWMVQSTLSTPDGRTVSRVVSQRRMIYVSSAGRLFVKSTVSSRQGERSAELAPGDGNPKGGARDIRFEGNRIVGMSTRGQGTAGRMVISFDSSFASCSVDVTIGRSGGPVIRRGRGGMPMELQSQSVSGQSCAIQEGNAVAQ